MSVQEKLRAGKVPRVQRLPQMQKHPKPAVEHINRDRRSPALEQGE